MTTPTQTDPELARRSYDYLHPQYRAARTEALARSKGQCQFCGERPAAEAHHWATDYPSEEEMTADDLTGLCLFCHTMATTIRRFRGDPWELLERFREQQRKSPNDSQPYQFQGGVAVPIARDIAILSTHKRGDFAGLRRMDPNEPDTAAFWRLMASEGLLGNPDAERKWALIMCGIALMTRTAADDNPFNRSAHNGSMPVGRALYESGYSETRFNRLLTARDDMLRVLLTRMFRMLAAEQATFDWREMAAFILNDGFNDERAEEGRRRLARAYYRAERRGSQQSETQQ